MNTDTRTGLAAATTEILAGAAAELGQLAGTPVSFAVSDTPPAAPGKGVGAAVTFAGPVVGSSQLILSESAATALAELASGIDLNDEATVASLAQVFTSFSAGVAKVLTDTLGSPAALKTGKIAASEPLPPPPDAMVIEFAAVVGDQADLLISWELDTAVAEGLADQWPDPAAPVSALPPPVAAPETASVANPARSSGVIDSVELDVAVELGNVALTIGELLHLGEGSVVTLTQTVGDEVVMLANGTPVASGEVVVVDGTLGFRVAELITDSQGA